jgi:hypothetical protein
MLLFQALAVKADYGVRACLFNGRADIQEGVIKWRQGRNLTLSTSIQGHEKQKEREGKKKSHEIMSTVSFDQRGPRIQVYGVIHRGRAGGRVLLGLLLICLFCAFRERWRFM